MEVLPQIGAFICLIPNIRAKCFFKPNNLYIKILVLGTIFLKSRFFLKLRFICTTTFLCYLRAYFLQWNQNSKFWVTWPRIAQSVYFLREMCSFFNLWIIKFTIMFSLDINAWNFSTKVLYISKNTLSLKWLSFAQFAYFLKELCFFKM